MAENSLREPFNPLQIMQAEGEDEYVAELMRNNISEIINSYHHDFDHFYESVQNGVDACEKAFRQSEEDGSSADYTPSIKIIVNLNENSLTVVDNGTGMSTDIVLKYFFTPYATLKSKVSERQRGEKGVGSSFLSYGSNRLCISTISRETKELTSGELRDALKWCRKELDLIPMPKVIPAECHPELQFEHGTAVTVFFCDQTNMTDLSEYGETVDQWEAIIRLQTALGYVDFSDGDAFLKALRATLAVVDKQGKTNARVLTTGYLYPHLATEANVRLTSLTRDAKGRLPEAQRDMDVLWETFTYDQVSDLVTKRMDNIPYLRRVKKDRLSTVLNVHKPEAYVAFTYGSDFWRQRNDKIWGTDREGQLNHGFIFATKTQRIGEQKRIDFTFRTGDFSRFFVLLSMRELKSDVGRKSLPEEIAEFGNFFANAVQRKFTEEDDCLKPSPGPFDETQEADLEHLKDAAFGRVDLGTPWLNFSKIPGEEQDVVGIFFNLLGTGKIRGYDIFTTHISRTYDGVGKFVLEDKAENYYNPTTNRLGIAQDKFRDGKAVSPSRCFIEFKYDTDGLVKDVRSGYKRLQDIKWLVCWQIGTRHTGEGIGIIDITEPAQINRRDYYGVTHLMTENQDKVFVICLKTVLDLLANQ